MLDFRGTSIRRKLTRAMMLTSSVALLVASAFFAFYDSMTIRDRIERDLATLATIIGSNSKAALTFADEKAAQETLAALSAKPHVVAAAIYDAGGNRFAEYLRQGASPPPLPRQAGDPGYRLERGYLVIFQPVTNVNQAVIGTVFIREDMQEASARLRQYVGFTLLILALSLLIAYLLSSRLQRAVSEPILDLAQTARNVSLEQNYAARAVKRTDDEIGLLIDQFNQMLGQIEKRDAALRDLNEDLVESERNALAANEAKSAFLAKMSHELRTPMNAILGYSEMLMEEAEDLGQEDFLPDLKRIHAAGKHLLSLINDVLDLSKIEAGRMELFLETFDVCAMIEDVTATVQPLVEKNANTLEVDCPPQAGSMRADLTKVRQSLFNLLSNASKFTDHGTIALAVRRSADGNEIRFDVRDTGIGMTEEQLGHVFEAFTQAEAATASKYGGTGLGLTITRRFCEMMGGEISVASTPGVGTTFTITLPAEVTPAGGVAVASREAQAAPAAAPPATGEKTPSGGRARILVIDDDAAVRDLMESILVREGYEMEGAASGEEGLRIARELHPDLITLDVVMPGTDGWTVLAALKADPQLADVPVILVTIMDNRNLGFTLGASDYLTKPIERDRLLTVLKKRVPGHAPWRVLVVDDDPDVRTQLRRILEKEGYQVAEAENGLAALERVAEGVPSLVLLDLLMPVMDGFGFVHELRQHEAWRAVPVVILTSKDVTDEDRARLSGNVQQIILKGSGGRDALVTEISRLLRTQAGNGERGA
jgi:signal transduction histidine kinase/DNA-binding response OmpR family regulator